MQYNSIQCSRGVLHTVLYGWMLLGYLFFACMFFWVTLFASRPTRYVLIPPHPIPPPLPICLYSLLLLVCARGCRLWFDVPTERLRCWRRGPTPPWCRCSEGTPPGYGTSVAVAVLVLILCRGISSSSGNASRYQQRDKYQYHIAVSYRGIRISVISRHQKRYHVEISESCFFFLWGLVLFYWQIDKTFTLLASDRRTRTHWVRPSNFGTFFCPSRTPQPLRHTRGCTQTKPCTSNTYGGQGLRRCFKALLIVIGYRLFACFWLLGAAGHDDESAGVVRAGGAAYAHGGQQGHVGGGIRGLGWGTARNLVFART